MATAQTYDATGQHRGTVDLPEPLFGGQVHEHLLYESVKAYLANQRQGTHKVKSRSEMKGGGRKPWKQKGTGRARSGSNTSPVWVGGGRAFGPKPRDYRLEVPKKQRRAALVSGLSLRAQEDRVFVIADPELSEPKTREVAAMIEKIGIEGGRTLLVIGKTDLNLVKSCRNIPGLRISLAALLTPYFLMECDQVVFTESGLARLQEVFGS